MPNVEARLKVKGKSYEIMVDLDEALKVKAGTGNIMSAMQSPAVYHDVKKALVVPQTDLKDAFNTIDIYEIAKQIILKGEVQKTQDFRDNEREAKKKQVIALILKNAVDQRGMPYTEARLNTAVDQVHFNFDNRPAEKQMTDLMHKLKEVIPIKIEVKRVQLTIPAQFTGQVYGLLQDYKEEEEWLSNGNLRVIMNIPAGLIIDFYDKLNKITHGAVQSQELKTQ
jgi:ribosome maturation protein SDO1